MTTSPTNTETDADQESEGASANGTDAQLDLIDIHTHIHQFPRAERADVVRRATGAGVGQLVVAGTSVRDSTVAIAVARMFDGVVAGVGIHPDAIDARVPAHDLQRLDELAQDGEVHVMSEVGIDFLNGVPSHRHQQNALRAQIEIAVRRRLPVVYHAREQSDDLSRHEARDAALEVLQDAGVEMVGGAAHYFQGDYDYASDVLDLGLYVSLAKPLLRSSELQAVAKRLPLDGIVLETDSYPQPFKRNRARWTEPRDLPLIAACLADLHGTTTSIVARQTTINALRLLKSEVNAHRN